MILLDYFWVFCQISGKMDEINKSWQFQGPQQIPMPLRGDPTQRRGDPTQ